MRKVGEKKSNHARIFQNFLDLDPTSDHAEKPLRNGVQNPETELLLLLTARLRG